MTSPVNGGGAPTPTLGRISRFFGQGWAATKMATKGVGRYIQDAGGYINRHVGDTFALTRPPSTTTQAVGYAAAGVSSVAAAAVATKATENMSNKAARGGIITASGVAGAAAPGALSKLIKTLIRKGA